MKKILYVVVLLMGMIVVSCKVPTEPVKERTWGEKPSQSSEKVQSRIILKDYDVIKGHSFYIIEVDGHEYLAMGDGALIPLVKNE